MRERRIQNEYMLLIDAAVTAPDRISSVTRSGDTLHLRMARTPALIPEPPITTLVGHIRTEHAVRIVFPRYFPAMPIEAFVEDPVFHPNTHPDTGFLCLWSTHRVAHTVLNALARVAAILSWQLINRDPEHLMQPEALAWYDDLAQDLRAHLPLAVAPLPFPNTSLPPAPAIWRRRLS